MPAYVGATDNSVKIAMCRNDTVAKAGIMDEMFLRICSNL